MKELSKRSFDILFTIQIVFIVLKHLDLMKGSWPVALIPFWIIIASQTVFIILRILSNKKFNDLFGDIF